MKRLLSMGALFGALWVVLTACGGVQSKNGSVTTPSSMPQLKQSAPGTNAVAPNEAESRESIKSAPLKKTPAGVEKAPVDPGESSSEGLDGDSSESPTDSN